MLGSSTRLPHAEVVAARGERLRRVGVEGGPRLGRERLVRPEIVDLDHCTGGTSPGAAWKLHV